MLDEQKVAASLRAFQPRLTINNQRRTTKPSLTESRPVLRGSEQFVLLTRISETELDHPSVGVRCGIHECWLLVEPIVDVHDLATERRVKLGDGLHGFDGAEHVVLSKTGSDLRKLDEDNVSELSLSVIGDAN